MTARFITPEQARRFYDRIGRGQDARPVSERRALDALAAQGDFARAGAVVEFGCGTGRLVLGSFVRTIQMHCGGQTLAQMPHDVHLSSFFCVSKTRNGM